MYLCKVHNANLKAGKVEYLNQFSCISKSKKTRKKSYPCTKARDQAMKVMKVMKVMK